MRKLVFGLLSLSLTLVACQLPSPQLATPVQLNAASAVNGRAIVNSRFSYSSDRSELTVILIYDSGETIEYSALRRPLDGFSVQAQTTIKRNGSVVSSARTTPSEAQVVLKTVANNGWQEVFKDIKERYRLAGLVN